MQNRRDGLFGVEQFGQIRGGMTSPSGILWPHFMQNRRAALFGVPQLAQMRCSSGGGSGAGSEDAQARRLDGKCRLVREDGLELRVGLARDVGRVRQAGRRRRALRGSSKSGAIGGHSRAALRRGSPMCFAGRARRAYASSQSHRLLVGSCLLVGRSRLLTASRGASIRLGFLSLLLSRPPRAPPACSSAALSPRPLRRPPAPPPPARRRGASARPARQLPAAARSPFDLLGSGFLRGDAIGFSALGLLLLPGDAFRLGRLDRCELGRDAVRLGLLGGSLLCRDASASTRSASAFSAATRGSGLGLLSLGLLRWRLVRPRHVPPLPTRQRTPLRGRRLFPLHPRSASACSAASRFASASACSAARPSQPRLAPLDPLGLRLPLRPADAAPRQRRSGLRLLRSDALRPRPAAARSACLRSASPRQLSPPRPSAVAACLFCRFAFRLGPLSRRLLGSLFRSAPRWALSWAANLPLSLCL